MGDPFAPDGPDIEARIGPFAAGRATIVRNGRRVDLIGPLVPPRADGAPTHRSARGLDDDAAFRLVRIVRVDREPFLVGVTNDGTIHAASLIDHGSGAIPLLGLRTLPRELARFEVIATPDALVVLAEGSQGYLVRSMARPSRSTRRARGRSDDDPCGSDPAGLHDGTAERHPKTTSTSFTFSVRRSSQEVPWKVIVPSAGS